MTLLATITDYGIPIEVYDIRAKSKKEILVLGLKNNTVRCLNIICENCILDDESDIPCGEQLATLVRPHLIDTHPEFYV